MRIILVLISLFWSFQLLAQQVPTRQFTTKNGLLSNDVSALHIDSRGRLWIGSKAGLAVQTSEGFRQDSVSIRYKFNNITSIAEDSDGELWVGSYGEGVLYRHIGQTKLLREKDGLVSNRVRKIRCYKDAMYIATHNGVSIVSLATQSIRNPVFQKAVEYNFEVTDFFEYEDKVYATTINNGIYEVTDSHLLPVSKLKRILSAYSSEQGVFIGTEDALLKYDMDQDTVIARYTIPYAWRAVAIDKQLLWVSSGLYSNKGGLYSFKKEDEVVNISKQNGIVFHDFKSIAYDPKKELLFVGTNTNGLLQLEWNTAITQYKEYGKTHTTLVLEDKTVLVTETGIQILKKDKPLYSVSLEQLKKYQVKQEHKFKAVATKANHFYEIDYATPASKIVFYQGTIEKNSIWLATNIGVFKISLNGSLESYFPIHTYHFIFFKGQFFETNPYGGVRIYEDIETMKYRYYSEALSVDIPRDIVSITQDEQAVYFASALDGLYQYSEGKFKSFMRTGEFMEPKLRKVTIENTNSLLVATDFNDIYRLNFTAGKATASLAVSNTTIQGNNITLLKAFEDKVYVGTNWGLNVFGAAEYYFIDAEQGLNYTLIFDGSFYNHSLLLSTTDGVFKIELSSFEKKKVTFTPFVYSLKVNANAWESNKVVQAFLEPTIPIDLRHNENNLQLYFDVLNVKYPDKLKYYYRLKDDEDWRVLTEKGRIDLQYLEPNTYAVELKVVDHYASQEKVFLLGTFAIHPPFYMQLPFLVIAVLVTIVVVFYLFKRRFAKLKRKEARDREMEQLKTEQERKKLIADRHYAEMRLQALQSQMDSHFVFNILTSLQYHIMGDDKREALNYLDRFAKFIRFTLEFSAKKMVTLEEELTYLERYVAIEKLRSDREIAFHIENKDEVPLSFVSIPPLLLQPFVENSLLHAFPPKITHPEIRISILKHTEGVEVVIRDNGIGIDTANEESTWHKPQGINLVQERISLIQNKMDKEIEIHSSDEGTAIHIFLTT